MDVGAMDALHGDLDNVILHVFAMKGEGCVIMLISTYAENEWMGEEKIRTIRRNRISFNYPETVHNYCQHIDYVDSHNARRQAPISLEETLSTRRL